MAIIPLSWTLIALGGIVAVAGLALFASLIRRKAIAATLVLALIMLAFAGAWLVLAQGRMRGSSSRWTTRWRASDAEWTAPLSFADAEAEFTHELEESRKSHCDVSELVLEEMRRAELYKLEAEALARTHDSLVVSEGGPVVVLAPTPLPPSVPIEAVGPATVHTLTQQYLQKPWLGHWRIIRGGLVWNLVTALSIAALLFVAYVFLDASTRGHFTWSLRILSALVLVGIFATMAALRSGL